MAIFNKMSKSKLYLNLSVFLFSPLGLATSASVQFNANIAYEGACEISVPATVSFNNGNEILPSQIESKASVAKQTFNLTLANCKGVKVTPKIVVSGNTNSVYGEDLFLDTTSAAKGYGILLQTIGNKTFRANTNLATNKLISAVENWNVDTNLTTINGTLPMTATLTCSDCKAADRIGGELKSNVTFDFQYD